MSNSTEEVDVSTYARLKACAYIGQAELVRALQPLQLTREDWFEMDARWKRRLHGDAERGDQTALRLFAAAYRRERDILMRTHRVDANATAEAAVILDDPLPFSAPRTPPPRRSAPSPHPAMGATAELPAVSDDQTLPFVAFIDPDDAR